MASIVPKLLFIGNQQSGTIYSAPSSAGSYAIVKSINVANTATGSEIFSINLVTAGNVPGTSNVIVGNITLSANNVFSYETSIVMPAGSALQITQSSNHLTFTISGVEYVV
jgi:DeoR/GlpR family transcriptional regulator of sugar metabolism